MQDSEVPIAHQCRMLSLSRSRLYYSPKGVPGEEFAMMRIFDELYIEDPTRGTRRMCLELCEWGYDIGHTRTRRLMKVMH